VVNIPALGLWIGEGAGGEVGGNFKGHGNDKFEGHLFTLERAALPVYQLIVFKL